METLPGDAKAAVAQRVYDFLGAAEDMVIPELNPAPGKYESLFITPKGTLKSQRPW